MQKLTSGTAIQGEATKALAFRFLPSHLILKASLANNIYSIYDEYFCLHLKYHYQITFIALISNPFSLTFHVPY